MNTALALQHAKSIWEKAAQFSYNQPLDPTFELSIHRKLLNLFHFGPFYYYFFNVAKGEIEFVSDSMTRVLGFAPEDFSVAYLFDRMHPADLPVFLNFENKVASFFRQLPADQLMRYKVSYDFRIRKNNGNYVRLLHQVITIESNEQGNVSRTLGIHTDITPFKQEGKPILSFIDLEGDQSYLNVEVDDVYTTSKEVLTFREKQVLQELIHGKSSKQVAHCLCIAKETVDRHRKNMLAKTKTFSTAELVGKALREGWL